MIKRTLNGVTFQGDDPSLQNYLTALFDLFDEESCVARMMANDAKTKRYAAEKEAAADAYHTAAEVCRWLREEVTRRERRSAAPCGCPISTAHVALHGQECSTEQVLRSVSPSLPE